MRCVICKWIIILLVSMVTGLVDFGAATMASQPEPGSTEVKSNVYVPPQPGTGDFDWIQLRNGEWLKGQIKDLQDESLSFESDQLDSLKLDWDDIHTVYSQRQHTCVFEDNSSVLGRIRIVGDRFTAVSYTHLTLPTTPYV